HARPFPFISDLSLNLVVWLKRDTKVNHQHEFVRLKVPDVLPRMVDVGRVMRTYADDTSVKDTFVWLEDVIAHNLDMLFPGMKVVEQFPFRVTRNADIDYEQEEEEV